MATRIITVDIDSHAVRLLQVEGDRVERWATAPLEAGVVKDDAIANTQALSALLKALRSSVGIGGGDVVASVSGLFSVARLMSMTPALPAEMLQRAREALPGEDLRLLWQTLRINGANQDVLVVGASTEQVDAQVGVLRAAGLAPRALELKTIAMARTLNGSDGFIVNVEPTSLDMVLVLEGIPQVIRTLALSPTASPEARANQVAQALDHTIAFYNARHSDAPVPASLPLILVGPMGDDPYLRQRLMERADYSLGSFAPSLGIPPHLPAAEYAVNIGLALRELSRAKKPHEEMEGPTSIRINLVPPTISRFAITPQRVGFLAVLVVGMALAYLLFQLIGTVGRDVAAVQRDLDAIQRQVSVKQADIARLAQLDTNIKDIKALTAPWGHVSQVRALLESILTPGVQLSNIAVEGNKVTFAATAGSVEEAIDFVEAMRASGRFSRVPYSRTETSVGGTFELLPPKAK